MKINYNLVIFWIFCQKKYQHHRKILMARILFIFRKVLQIFSFVCKFQLFSVIFELFQGGSNFTPHVLMHIKKSMSNRVKWFRNSYGQPSPLNFCSLNSVNLLILFNTVSLFFTALSLAISMYMRRSFAVKRCLFLGWECNCLIFFNGQACSSIMMLTCWQSMFNWSI